MVKNKGHTCPDGRGAETRIIGQSAIAPAMDGVHSRRYEDQNVIVTS